MENQDKECLSTDKDISTQHSALLCSNMPLEPQHKQPTNIFVYCTSLDCSMPCQVPSDCSYAQLYELAIACQGFSVETALAKTASLESHRGRLIARTNETMPAATLQTFCTLKLSFTALFGGSTNVVVPDV